ncbi:FecR family protein [Parabacteroides sp.]
MDQQRQQEYYDELITGYLSRSLSHEQEKELSRWVAADESHKKYYYEMTELWISSYDTHHKNKKKNEAVFRRFAEKAGLQKQKNLFLRKYIQIAASLLVGIFLGITGLYLLDQSDRQNELAMVRTIEVPLGSRSRIQLEDGSIVWLNAGSKLSCQAGFSQKNRQVILEGEGYFEVAHNEKYPFIVNAKEIDVKVLGTKFNIKAYSDEQEIAVTLAEGSVNMIDKATPSNSIIMVPQQQAIYNKLTGKTNIRKVSTDAVCQWITGAHFFNEISFEEIAGQLEKAFDVTFIFRNAERRQLRFFGEFRSTDTLDDILTIMSSSEKFTYKRNNNIIEIY